MVIPKKNTWEKIVEWAYKHRILVHRVNRNVFKAKIADSDIPVNWTEDGALRVLSIGQSHIDAAWLWRKDDTRTKKINYTFDRALMHMEMYEDKPFTYTQNQAVYYSWVKKNYPRIWQGIQKRFKEGRWEVVDGAWVESDVNVPSAESLIRQRLIGQYFYLKNFGMMSDIAWLDDVFGFPFQLPQILAKSNARYFLTNKFCYNDTNIWPYHSMIWRGPDGESEVLFSWNQHKNNWYKYLKTFRELSVLVKDGEKVVLNYMSDFDEAKKKFMDEFLPFTPNVFGHGDGGHGPKPVEIVEQLTWDEDKLVKMGTMRDYFNYLEDYRDNLPIWQDELYLENHRGTLTSIHMIKENNKTSEVLLHDIEYLNVLNTVLGNEDYQSEISELWKPVLFGQFHDVLPGSSIPEVYRDCAEDYEHVYIALYDMHHQISSKLTSDSEQFCLKTINTLSWTRSGIISVKIAEILNFFNIAEESIKQNSRIAFEIVDHKNFSYKWDIFPFPHYDRNREYSAGLHEVTGKDYQRSTDGYDQLESMLSMDWREQYVWIHIPEENPLGGFETRLLSIKNLKLETSEIQDADGKKSLDADKSVITLNNGLLSAKIDSRTGKIISVLDSENNREIEVIKSIGLTLYEDKKTNFDAWNIHPDYLDNPVDMPEFRIYERLNENSPISGILLKSKKSKAGTTYLCYIYLIDGLKQIFFETFIDWQEDHKLLKFSVHPNYKCDKVRNGMQYGSIERVTVPKNRFNNYRAKFEYPNQQWSSNKGQINDIEYEIVLLNRNKYGIFAHNSVMELSFLKAAHFKNPTDAATLDDDNPRPKITDLGFHRLSASVKFNDSSDIPFDYRAGYEFNHPIQSLKGSMEENRQGLTNKIFSLDENPENIIIGAIKSNEEPPKGNHVYSDWFLNTENDAKWIIFRLAEFYGIKTDINLKIDANFQILKAVEVDLLERKISIISQNSDSNESVKREIDIASQKNTVNFVVKPYEILTIAVNLRQTK